MTAVLAILAKAWPFILMVGGVIFGVFRHQQAKTATAQANQKVAEADARVAQNDAALAKANETAAQAGAAAVKERENVENDIAAGKPGDAAQQLHNDWSRD